MNELIPVVNWKYNILFKQDAETSRRVLRHWILACDRIAWPYFSRLQSHLSEIVAENKNTPEGLFFNELELVSREGLIFDPLKDMRLADGFSWVPFMNMRKQLEEETKNYLKALRHYEELEFSVWGEKREWKYKYDLGRQYIDWPLEALKDRDVGALMAQTMIKDHYGYSQAELISAALSHYIHHTMGDEAFALSVMKPLTHCRPEDEHAQAVVGIVMKAFPMPRADVPIKKILKIRSRGDAKHEFQNFRNWLQNSVKQTPKDLQTVQIQLEKALLEFEQSLGLAQSDFSVELIECVLNIPFEEVDHIIKLHLHRTLEPFFKIVKRILSYKREIAESPERELAYLHKVKKVLK